VRAGAPERGALSQSALLPAVHVGVGRTRRPPSGLPGTGGGR
jgi:hypothetical protein